jgi:hypothetical protein
MDFIHRTAEGQNLSAQPLMVRTFLKVYMEFGSYFLFLQEQIKDIIILPPEDPSRSYSAQTRSRNGKPDLPGRLMHQTADREHGLRSAHGPRVDARAINPQTVSTVYGSRSAG